MKRPSLSSFFNNDKVIEKLRGPRGFPGKNGDAGDTPSQEELEALILPLIPDPIKGDDGHTPTTKELLPLIKNLIPEVQDGKTPTRDELIEIILPLIPSPKEMIVELDTPKEIVEKINKSRGEKIKKSKVEGLEELTNGLQNNGRQIQKILSFGGANFINVKNAGAVVGQIQTINFTNATISSVGNGGEINVTTSSMGIVLTTIGTSGAATLVGSTLNIPQYSSATGSGFQIPTGTVDGTNKIFVFATAPNAICVDGATLQKTEQGSLATQNWSGTTTVTLLVSPTQSVFAVA